MIDPQTGAFYYPPNYYLHRQFGPQFAPSQPSVVPAEGDANPQNKSSPPQDTVKPDQPKTTTSASVTDHPAACCEAADLNADFPKSLRTLITEADPTFKQILCAPELPPLDEGLCYFATRLDRLYKSRWLFRRILPVALPQQNRSVRALIAVGDQQSRLHPWLSSGSAASARARQPEALGNEMRMVVVGESDLSVVYDLRCDEAMFAQIKQDQNLHVTFADFTRRVISLLTTIHASSDGDPDDSESIMTRTSVTGSHSIDRRSDPFTSQLLSSFGPFNENSQDPNHREAGGRDGNQKKPVQEGGWASGGFAAGSLMEGGERMMPSEDLASTAPALKNSSFMASMTNIQTNSASFNIVESTEFRSLTHVTLQLRRLPCCEARRLLAGEAPVRAHYAHFLETQFVHAALKGDRSARDLEETRVTLTNVERDLSARLDQANYQHQEEAKGLQQSLESQRAQSKMQIAELTHTLDVVKTERNLLSEQVSTLKKTQDMCAEAQALNVSLEKDKQKLQAEVQELLKVAARDRENTEIINGLADERAQYETLRSEHAKYRNQSLELERELDTVRIEYDDCQKKLRDAERAVESLKARFDETRLGLEELREVFSERNEEFKEKEKEFARLTDLNSALQQDCARLHQMNFELNKRLTETLVRMAKRDQPEHFGAAGPSTRVEEMLFPEAPSAARRGQPPTTGAADGGKLDFSFAPKKKASTASVPVTAFTMRRNRRFSEADKNK